jgi:hypothetical protein
MRPRQQGALNLKDQPPAIGAVGQLVSVSVVVMGSRRVF